MIVHKSSRRSGFTLVELMVVIVIIGIMAAMIIPELHGTFQSALLRASSRQWIDAISLANSRAISMNQAHRLRLDRHANQYLIEKHVPSGGDPEGYVPVEDDSSRGKVDARIAVEFRSPMQEGGDGGQQAAPEPSEDIAALERGETISFYADGTAEAREIVLRDQDGFRLALRISAVTARVQIVELERQ